MSDPQSSAYRGAEAPVATFMADTVVTIDRATTLRRAAEVIVEASIGCIVVGTQDQVEGVISERDVVRAIAEGRDPDTTSVAELESTRLVWASPDATVGSVAEEMMTDYVRHVLVGEDGEVAGIVSMRDVISAYTT